MSARTDFISATAPASLQDEDLERHISRLLLTLDSIRTELVDSWNHPAKQTVVPILREQLAATVDALDASLYVWQYRKYSMR